MNEPPLWESRGELLTVRTGAKTDFWRGTHYGFIAHSGHFGYEERRGDFTATVKVSGTYEVLYDQAGLMVWVDERHWVKGGIEFTDGVAHLSVVVTREHSDWSMIALPAGGDSPIELRLTRHGTTIRVEYRLGEGGARAMVRLAYLPCPDGGEVRVGVMACSPKREGGAGFEARFDGFAVGEAISAELHDGGA